MKTVVQYVRRFQITASIIEMKRTCRRCDEEVDESGAMLEEEIYFGLHSNEARLHHHHELQQSCCIEICIRHIKKEE
jgi:hypothetical protein